MNKKWFQMGMISLILIFAMVLMGCPTGSTEKSDDAALTSITIKGKTATLGTPNASLGNVTAGTVSLLAADLASGAATNAVLADSKASLKMVKFAAGDTITADAFTEKEPFVNTDAIADEDVFVVLVTAEDGTKLYYAVMVNIVASNVTLLESHVESDNAFTFNNISFFISEDYYELSELLTDVTYDEIVEYFEFGNPVTAVTSDDADNYLYAFEFTAKNSGTLKKYSESGTYIIGDENDEDISIELIEATTPVVAHTLTATNVSGEDNFANVTFIVSEEPLPLGMAFYNNMTRADFSGLMDAGLGAPIASIYDYHEGLYLLAFEFTGTGNTATLKRFGEHDEELTGTETDAAIVITLTNAGNPPAQPSASIAGSPVTLTATGSNILGEEGEPLGETITITLANATLAYDLELYPDGEEALEYFSEIVDGLFYDIYGEAGSNTITIDIYGDPEEASTAEATFSPLPIGTILDDNNSLYLDELVVSGSIKYNIDMAEDPVFDPPSASFEDITLSGTVMNNVGNGSTYINESITITLANATVDSLPSYWVDDMFSETVEGLEYYGSVSDDTTITIDISGYPEEESYAEAIITIPAGILRNELGVPNTEPVVVSGTVTYDIDKAVDEIVDPISDFEFSPYGVFYANHESTVAGATIGYFENVEGGTGMDQTFSLVSGDGDTDNGLFRVSFNELYVGYDADLTEAKTYSIRVQVVDSSGETFAQPMSVVVGEITPLVGFAFEQDETFVVGNVPFDSDYQEIDYSSYIGAFTAEGGLAPFEYELVSGDGDTNNIWFRIYNDEYTNEYYLQGNYVTYTEGEYSVRVSVTDSSVPAVTKEQVVTFRLDYLKAATPISATISTGGDVSIDGVVNGEYPNYNNYLYIDLENISLNLPSENNIDVSSWFSSTVDGLTYTISNGGVISDSVTINILGKPTEASSEEITITIPVTALLDSNENPTIDTPIVVEVIGGTIKYDITQMVAEIVSGQIVSRYESLQEAVTAAISDYVMDKTITILADIELSEPITISHSDSMMGVKNITLKAGSKDVTISAAEGFTSSTLFIVQTPRSGSSSYGGNLLLGNGSGTTGSDGDLHSPTLIIDGKKRVDNLILVDQGSKLYTYNGVELRNASDAGIRLEGSLYVATAYINGGVIAGSGIGVNSGTASVLTMIRGIIYGTDGGADANGVSIQVVGNSSAAMNEPLSSTGGDAGDGKYTKTFGTAPAN